MMLKVENLSTSYKTIDGDVSVLNNINFEIQENEILASQVSQAVKDHTIESLIRHHRLPAS